MAEPEISQMCVEFNKRILFDFVHVNFRNYYRLRNALGLGLDVLTWRV